MKSSRFLLKNAAVYTSSNILNATIPFLLLPILTRVLAPADYGVIAMFSATLGILGAFTGLSAHGAVNVRFVDREGIDYPRYVGSCLFVLLTSTLLTLGVVAIFLKPLSDFTAIPPLWLLLAVLISGGNFLIQVRLGIWLMGKRPFAYGAFQICLSLLNMGLSLLFVLVLNYGFEGRFLGQALAVCCFSVVAVLSLRMTGWIVFRPRLDYMREALAFGVPLVPHVIGGFLLASADRFIINEKLGVEAAGLYMVAVQLGMGMGLVADAFNKAFVPWLYEQLKEGDLSTKQRIVRGTWLYFVVALIIAGVVAYFSDLIVFIVAGPIYIAASSALFWLAFGQAFNGMYLMVTNYIFYKRKTRFLAFVTLLSGFFGLSTAFFLVPLLGIEGAGLAFCVAVLFKFLLTWFLSQKVYPMPWFTGVS